MATNHINTTAIKKISALEKFHISFEYDRSWTDAKQTVQLRPSK